MSNESFGADAPAVPAWPAPGEAGRRGQGQRPEGRVPGRRPAPLDREGRRDTPGPGERPHGRSPDCRRRARPCTSAYWRAEPALQEGTAALQHVARQLRLSAASTAWRMAATVWPRRSNAPASRRWMVRNRSGVSRNRRRVQCSRISGCRRQTLVPPSWTGSSIPASSGMVSIRCIESLRSSTSSSSAASTHSNRPMSSWNSPLLRRETRRAAATPPSCPRTPRRPPPFARPLASSSNTSTKRPSASATPRIATRLWGPFPTCPMSVAKQGAVVVRHDGRPGRGNTDGRSRRSARKSAPTRVPCTQ